MAEMEINVPELLLKISNDVSIVKADMEHLKNEIAEIKEESQNNNSKLKNKIYALEERVEVLENEKNMEDAKKWRKITGYIVTALGTAFVTFIMSHLGDFLHSLGGN